MVGLLVPLVVVVLVVLAIRRAQAGADLPSDGHAVRRLFQLLLLYGLAVVLATGLSGLLGRLWEPEVLFRGDETALARDLAFVVVGTPLLLAVLLWTRRLFAASGGEALAFGWAFYITTASLTALVILMISAHRVLSWAVGLQEYDVRPVAQVLVWGGLWGLLWWVDARVTPGANTLGHHLLGSLIGLVVAATGLGALLAGTLRILVGLDFAAVLAVDGNTLRPGLVTLAVGAPVWFLYWLRTAVRAERTPFWLTHVLLAGVGGGLVTAIVMASTLLYSVLVWLIGDPRYTTAAVHFDAAPTSAAVGAVGAMVWWYHRSVLSSAGPEPRTEVRRLYEYGISALALLAAAGGLTLLVAALVEAASGTVLAGGGALNTLLAAVTLLVVGGPVWWWHWRRAQSAVTSARTVEISSPVRRVYLLVLFGVGGLAAVVALIVGAYLLFQDVVAGDMGLETLRRVRFAIGVLITTAGVAAYHWRVHRSDRGASVAEDAAQPRAPGFVLLVGPPDAEIAEAVAKRTHGQVQAWSTTGNGMPTWSVDVIMEALAGTHADDVIVLGDTDGVRAIPVHRR